MTIQELLAELRKLGVRPAQVIGEMGWKVEDIAKEAGAKLEDLAPVLAGEQWTALQEAQRTVGEMAEALGLQKDTKPADLVAAAKAAREAQVKAAQAERDQLIDKVIGEMVVAEAARPIVKRMLHVPDDADEAKVKKAVGELLQQDDVKQALASAFRQDVFRPTETERKDNGPSGLRPKRVAI